MQTTELAGLFELRGKLRAAVDLDGANGKRHAVLQGVEELGRGLGGGAGVRLHDIPTPDDVAGGELLEDHAWHRTHVQSIDLDQITGLQNRILLGFAHRIETRPQRASRSWHCRAGRLDQPALPFELRENASHHGG